MKEDDRKYGDINGTIIIAERQRRGRGRHVENKWISPRGGIWLSVILVPKINAAQSTFLPLCSAIAACDIINEQTSLSSKIKWPNDIVIRGKKVSGIMVNVSTEGEKINYAVIGIGINANIEVSAITSSIASNGSNNYSECLSGYTGVTSLQSELDNTTIDVPLMIQLLLEKLEHYYLELERDGPANIRHQWKKRADTLGKVVKIRTQSGIIEGIAIDIDNNGILLVKTYDGNVHRLI
jgi:BirA family transcriptional regulator, biotin operon repressor / biotin---[acetyl-CoA-carboxylase] ligase